MESSKSVSLPLEHKSASEGDSELLVGNGASPTVFTGHQMPRHRTNSMESSKSVHGVLETCAFALEDKDEAPLKDKDEADGDSKTPELTPSELSPASTINRLPTPDFEEGDRAPTPAKMA